MSPMPTLQLQVEEGLVVPVHIRRESAARSPHSGRDLRELHGWIATADAELHQALSTALRDVGERPVRALSESGEFTGRWCISWNSYGESAGVHTYVLLLREPEELSLEVLLLDGMELHPYEYRERVVGDGVAIWAKMAITPEDVQQLRGLIRARTTLPVVRRGIQDTPREMRVGVAEWSESADGLKCRLVLVEHGLDVGGHPELTRIEEENTRAAMGFYANFLERLAERLVDKGVLSRAEVDELRDAARLAPGTTHRELWRVVEVDEG